ncbi:MAG: hypothetical protein IJA09_00875 [Bacteroidales bacterium]|nr:hypothetical protein [Bacteroidales bacterium]
MKKILFSLLFVFCLIGVNAANNGNSEFTLTETVQYGGQCDASKPVRVSLYSYTEWNGEFSCQGFGYVREKNGKKVCAVNGVDYAISRSSRCEYKYMINYDGEIYYFNIE